MAVRAVQPLDARHPPHERLHRFHHDRVGSGRFERCACGGKVGGFVRGAKQTVVADTFEAAGQRMLHEAPDELGRLQAHRLLAVAVDRIAHPEAWLKGVGFGLNSRPRSRRSIYADLRAVRFVLPVMRAVCSVSVSNPSKAAFTASEVGKTLAMAGSSRTTDVPFATSL